MNIDVPIDIQKTISNYKELASCDFDILQEKIDGTTLYSHKAISRAEKQLIPVDNILRRSLAAIYDIALVTCRIEPTEKFKHDKKRGYNGFTVTSQMLINKGSIINGIFGVVCDAPSNLKYENSFSVFLDRRNGLRMFLGPLSFVNSSCKPKAAYVTHSTKPGIVKLRALDEITIGDEITVFYGKNYFGPGNKHCKCQNVKMHGNRTIVKRLRSQQLQYVVENKSSSSEDEQMFIRTMDESQPEYNDETLNEVETINEESRNEVETEGNDVLNTNSCSQDNKISADTEYLFEETLDANNQNDDTTEAKTSKENSAGTEINDTPGGSYTTSNERSCQMTADQIVTHNRFLRSRVRNIDEPVVEGDKRPLSCTVCYQDFFFTNIMNHMRAKHFQEVQLFCPVCQMEFRWFKSLKKHFEHHFNEYVEQLTSSQCVKTLIELEPEQEINRTQEASLAVENVQSEFEANSQTYQNEDFENHMATTELCYNVSFHQKSRPNLKRPKRRLSNIVSNVEFNCAQPNCSQKLEISKARLHLILFHSFELEFFCPLCPRIYNKIFCLSRHFFNTHSATVTSTMPRKDLVKIVPVIDVFEEQPTEDNQVHNIVCSDSSSCSESFQSLVTHLKNLSEGVLGTNMLFNMLKSSSMSLTQTFSSVNCAEDSSKELISTIISILENLQQYPESELKTCLKDVQNVLSSFQFSSITNDYQLQTYLGNQSQYVNPRQICFQPVFETRTMTNGLPGQKLVSRNFQYTSIIEVLKKTIFYHDETIDYINAYHNLLNELSENQIMIDTMQGKMFKENRNKSRNSESNTKEPTEQIHLSLQLYFDDIEPNNPIGSRSTIHKVSCFYWTLRNIPPWMNSDGNFIHVVALVSQLDIVANTFDKILQLISEEIQQLENGMLFKTKTGREIMVTGCHLQFVSDNLGNHQVLGFVENFSSGACCDICKVEYKEFKFNCTEDAEALRKPEETMSLALKATSIGKNQTGVKRVCNLRTRFFEPYDNWCADLQHDIFEGGLSYTIKSVLNRIIYTDKVFTLTELNKRINNFGYGRDADGKPTLLDEMRFKEVKMKSKQKADQMFTLMRFLPLMISDLVTDNVYEYWEFLLDYFDLVYKVLSSSFEQCDADILGTSIAQHLSRFRLLFPEQNITFKQHRLTHYPTILKRSGPFKNQCVMSYERKHLPFKKWAQVSMNFQNIMKTFMKRHQMQQFINWNTKMPCRKQQLFTSGKLKSKESILSSLHNDVLIGDVEVDADNNVFSANSVSVFGTTYKVNDCIILEMDEVENVPVFGKIRFIVAGEQEPVFVCETLRTVSYSYQSQSYLIEKSDDSDLKLKKQSSFYDYHPLSLHLCFDPECMNYHIVLRQKLGFNNFQALLKFQ